MKMINYNTDMSVFEPFILTSVAFRYSEEWHSNSKLNISIK